MDITGTLGNELSGRKIALCVTASVSITEAPRIARLLMRHGAEVIPILTPKAAEFVSPMIFEWSTGNAPITKLTGRVEHVELVTPPKKVDLVLIAPCTANTLGKVACGISDEPVSTLACTALGAGIPILIASAMHEPMLKNPIIQRAKEKLEQAGVRFIEGRLIESKSKIAEPDEILQAVISLIGNVSNDDKGKSPPSHLERSNERTKDLSGQSFVITAGPTREPIDNVRYITNASTGKMGVALTEEALLRGAKSVCLIHGPGVAIPDAFRAESRIQVQLVVTTEDMLEAVLSRLSKGTYDVLISAAAPADYTLVSPVAGKISTSDSSTLNLRLAATKKIISIAKEKFPKIFVVAFKAEYGLDNEDLTNRASGAKSSGVDLVVANNVARDDIGFGSDFNEVFIVMKNGQVKHLTRASKNEIASGILDAMLEQMQRSSPNARS
ncbi:MAG: phosphopantothenoylcysteine decarboxylase domain-containing protein [Nitrososphaerales archaeon]